MIILRKVRGLKGLTALFRNSGMVFSGGPMPLNFPMLSRGVMLAFGLLALVGFAIALALMSGYTPPDVATLDHTPMVMVAGSLASQLKEADDKVAAKAQSLHLIFEKAGDDVDFSKPDVLKAAGVADSKAVVEHVRALNDEINDLAKKRDEIANLKRIQDDNEKRRGTPANPVPQPAGNEDPTKHRRMSIGELVMKSRALAEFRKTKTSVMSEEEGYGLAELKATFLTSAGWAPESTRTGLVIDKATRPLQVLDIIPTGVTGQAAVKYMEETTLTHASAERAENADYAESAFALTERSETVRSIGASVPVTDEQLEDVEGSQSYLEQRLVFGNRQRLDGQVIIGDGNAPNLTGIKNKAGIQTQARGADPNLDAIYKAMVLVRVTGRAFPNAVVIHPTNWQTIRLAKTADGIYLWGSPSESGPERVWGIQVVQSDADAVNTAYVGDFANFCQLYERKGMEVAIGYVNDDFKKGRRTIRAGLRVAFAIYRAAAFCSVTGLN